MMKQPLQLLLIIILLCTQAQTIKAEGLLRLFTTPAQRAALDAARAKPVIKKPKRKKRVKKSSIKKTKRKKRVKKRVKKLVVKIKKPKKRKLAKKSTIKKRIRKPKKLKPKKLVKKPPVKIKKIEQPKIIKKPAVKIRKPKKLKPKKLIKKPPVKIQKIEQPKIVKKTPIKITKPKKLKPKIVNKQPIKIEIKKPKLPRYISFEGLMTRSDGTTTIWINGKNHLYREGFTIEIDKIKPDYSIPIILTYTKQIIILKPGQTYDTLEGKIKESYMIQK